MARFDAPLPAPGGKLPDCAGLKALRQRGWSYRDIQAEYGVSNQSVHRALRKCGLSEEHVDYSSIIPWQIRPEHRTQNVNILLRAAARRRLGVGKPLSANKERQLENWLRKLEKNDLVVAYGLGRAANGVESYGFHYTRRRPGIDDWIIRKPKAWIGGSQKAG